MLVQKMKGWKCLLAGCAALFALVFVSSCVKEEGDALYKDYDSVMIMVSAGRNSLSSNLYWDLEDLKGGYVPNWDDHKALVIISHLLTSSGLYADETELYVSRVIRGRSGHVYADTLKRYPTHTLLTKQSDFEEILRYVAAEFPSKHYGMVYSSHGWGYLPKGYYNHRNDVENANSGSGASYAPSLTGLRASSSGAFPFVPDVEPGEMPRTKSVGQEVLLDNGNMMSYEMDVDEFAASLPFHLDYLIMDACLMGSVETAWAFRGKTDLYVGSQAEIVSDGLDYANLSSRLLEGSTPDVEGVCRDYYAMYKDRTGWMKTATVSLVDTRAMDGLAAVCRELFSKYRTAILGLSIQQVQRYYTGNHPWFFDLKDILIQAGAEEAELARLQAALDACILYKATTPRILDGYDVKVFSGLSMYLPSVPGEYLRSFYRGLGWNQASGLVE